MELLIDILGYVFLSIIVVGIFYVFTKVLVGALSAMTKDDD